MSDLSYGLDIPLENLEYDEVEKWIVIPFAASLRRDRIGDFLEVGGIITDNHKENAVAYLDHGKLNQPLPIGKCKSKKTGEYEVWVDEKFAWAKIWLAVEMPGFPPPTPELIFEMYKGGFLKGGSIGFRPIDFEMIPADPQYGYFKPARHIKTCELEEVTICGLPMNQDTVKSYLAAGVIEGKPFENSLKCLLADSLQKTWMNGIDMSMKAMSANDQSTGGAMVAPAGTVDQEEKLEKGIIRDHFGFWFVDATGAKYGPYVDQRTALAAQNSRENKMMTKAEDKPDVGVSKPEDAKAEDKPDVGVTMEACKAFLEAAAEHDDTPDELREKHLNFAKAIATCMGKDEDESEEKSADESPAKEEDDLDLVKSVKEHLDESAEHEEAGPIHQAAYKFHAQEVAKCMKSDDTSETDETDEISEEEGEKCLSFLDRIVKRLEDSETKMFEVFGR